MEQLQAHSNNYTKLNDRILWYDGDSSYYSDNINKLYDIIDSIKYVDVINDEILKYNNLVDQNEKLKVKDSLKELSTKYNIPDEYKDLDVVDYVICKLDEKEYGRDDFDARALRCAEELILYKDKGLFDILRTLIFIINILESKSILWGVGRGSSVSSYVLYLIGVHDIDSFLYDLDITEFIR